jgi:hypothetical protein
MANDCKVIVDEKTVELLVSPEILSRSAGASLLPLCLPTDSLTRSREPSAQVSNSPQSHLCRRQLLDDLVSSSELRVRDPVFGSSTLARRRHPDCFVRLFPRLLFRLRTRRRPSSVLLSNRQTLGQKVQRRFRDE